MLEKTPNLSDMIRWELHSLQISPTLRGHHYLVYAIEQVANDPMRVKDVTKDLYPDTAHYFDTTWKAVERNIRSAVLACWNSEGKEELRRMTGYCLAERPRSAVFIALVAEHVSQRYQTRSDSSMDL